MRSNPINMNKYIKQKLNKDISNKYSRNTNRINTFQLNKNINYNKFQQNTEISINTGINIE